MSSESALMAAELLRGSTPFLFQAVTSRIRRADELRVGDRVMIDGRESFGIGVITALEPDGRLAQLSFGREPAGWWDRMDLKKEVPAPSPCEVSGSAHHTKKPNSGASRKDNHGCTKTNIS
ncbi:MAG TPA: hypothetical protein PK883_00675 [Anaerolineaceae bacterium]|nr:hypothetical protein [Anaerolineaceae bacterium]